MKATFQLDGCYELAIAGNVPRMEGSERSVHMQLNYTPLDPSMAIQNECASNWLPVPAGTKVIFAATMKPSHARAVASALLSAATEARA